LPTADDVPTTAGLIASFSKAPKPNSEPVTRNAIAARFIRKDVGPIPKPRSVQRQAQPEPYSDLAWDEVLNAYTHGLLNWNARHLGPAPGEEGCCVPLRVLKEYGLT
jgi:hypothetical protein